MPRSLDVFFSIASPWSHLGHAPLMELAAKHSLALRWRPMALPPLFAATGGVPLPKRSPQRQRYRFVELQRWAQKRGRNLNLRPKHWPFDARLADSVALALIALGEDPAGFIGAAMRGVWEEDRDLTDPATLHELLVANGLEADSALAAAPSEPVAAAYEANRVEAERIGVFGAPAYVLDGEVFWGQDRLDLLDEALVSGRPPFVADF